MDELAPRALQWTHTDDRWGVPDLLHFSVDGLLRLQF